METILWVGFGATLAAVLSTLQAKSQEARRVSESRARLDAALAAAGATSCEVRMPGGVAESVDAGWTRLLGFEPHEVAGDPIRWIAGRCESATRSDFLEVVSLDASVVRRGEFRFVHREGSERVLRFSSTPTVGGRRLVIGMDVTEGAQVSGSREAQAESSIEGGFDSEFQVEARWVRDAGGEWAEVDLTSRDGRRARTRLQWPRGGVSRAPEGLGSESIETNEPPHA